MAGKRILARVLRLRELEEEQSRLELELRLAARNQILAELESAHEQQQHGRRHFAAGVAAREAIDRSGGLLESKQALLRQGQIRPRLEKVEEELNEQQKEFLRRRGERRQLETLVGEARLAAARDAARRAQQVLDDWYARKRVSKTQSGEEAKIGLALEPTKSLRMEPDHF